MQRRKKDKVTAPLDTSIPRKRFPQWTPEEQDFWIDMFDAFCQQLMGASLEREEHSSIGRKDLLTAILTGDIKTASELADVAVEEMQYRFHIQQVPDRRSKRKSPANKTRKRT